MIELMYEIKMIVPSFDGLQLNFVFDFTILL